MTKQYTLLALLKDIEITDVWGPRDDIQFNACFISTGEMVPDAMLDLVAHELENEIYETWEFVKLS